MASRREPLRYSLNQKVTPPEDRAAPGDQNAFFGNRRRVNTAPGRAQSPAQEFLNAASGWISGKVKTAQKAFEKLTTQEAEECPTAPQAIPVHRAASQASRDGFMEFHDSRFHDHGADTQRDGFEHFYGYDAESPTPAAGNFTSPALESTWHLPDLDVLDVDFAPELEEDYDYDEVQKQPSLQLMISQVEASAKQVWGVLSHMSSMFPEESGVDGSTSSQSSKPRRRPNSRLPWQANVDQRKAREVEAMIAAGWMPPEQVKKLKAEYEILQTSISGMAEHANACSSGSHSVPPADRQSGAARRLEFASPGGRDDSPLSLPGVAQRVGEAFASGGDPSSRRALPSGQPLAWSPGPPPAPPADSVGPDFHSGESAAVLIAGLEAKAKAAAASDDQMLAESQDFKSPAKPKFEVTSGGAPGWWAAASMQGGLSPMKVASGSPSEDRPASTQTDENVRPAPKEPQSAPPLPTPASGEILPGKGSTPLGKAPPGKGQGSVDGPAPGPPAKNSGESASVAVAPAKAAAVAVPKEVPKEAPVSSKGKPPAAKGGKACGKGKGKEGKGPPGLPGKAPGKAKALAKSNLPKVSAKPLPLGRKVEWQPLSMESVVGTVFEGLLDWKTKEDPDGDKSQSTENSVDEKRLIELFKPKATSSAKAVAKPKAKAVQLLPSQRVQNMSIALRKSPVTAKMLAALESLDYETDAISAEACEMLMNAVPTLDETRLLLGYTGPFEELGKTEQQVLPLARLEKPAVGQRLRVMLFGRTMGELAKHLRDDFYLLKSAFTEARSSKALKVVLYHTVQLGNYINYGALKREDAVAAGFGLDALLKMEFFKAAADSRLSLLHTLIVQISSANPDLAQQVRNELASVGRASKLQFSTLVEDATAFRRESQHVATCAKSMISKDQNGDIDAVTRLESLTKKAADECTSLEDELTETRAAAKETLDFFAVASKAQETDLKIVDLLKLLSRFVETFERCTKELDDNPKLKTLCTGPQADPNSEPAEFAGLLAQRVLPRSRPSSRSSLRPSDRKETPKRVAFSRGSSPGAPPPTVATKVHTPGAPPPPSATCGNQGGAHESSQVTAVDDSALNGTSLTRAAVARQMSE